MAPSQSVPYTHYPVDESPTFPEPSPVRDLEGREGTFGGICFALEVRLGLGVDYPIDSLLL